MQIKSNDGSVAAMVEATLRRIYSDDLSTVSLEFGVGWDVRGRGWGSALRLASVPWCSTLQVHMCHNTSKLDPLVAEYEKRKEALTGTPPAHSLHRAGQPQQGTGAHLQAACWRLVSCVCDTSLSNSLLCLYPPICATDMVDNYISLKRRGKEMKVKEVGAGVFLLGDWRQGGSARLAPCRCCT